VHPDVFAWFGTGGKSVEKEIDASLPGVLQHLSAYLLLGTMFCIGFVRSRASAVWVLCLLALHGLTTEAIQAWVPNRTCDWRDLMANMLGAIFSVALCPWIVSRMPRRLFEASFGILFL